MDQYALISYSSKDADKADRFRKALNANGVKTWMAPGDIPPGMQYGDAIMNAIRECACFLVLISDSAQRSVFVKKELERAESYRKPVIPVLLENVPLQGAFELFLSEHQSVDVRNPDDLSPEMRQIIRRVRQYTDSDNGAAGASEQAARPESAKHAHRPKRARRIAAAVLALCVLAVGIIGLLLSRRGNEQQTGQSAPQWHVLTDSIVSSVGYMQGEGPENLFDGDLNTKWCVPLNEMAFVEWRTSDPIHVWCIRFGIGSDSYKYPDRTPLESALYGYREADSGSAGEWELIWQQQKAFTGMQSERTRIWNDIAFTNETAQGSVKGALRPYSRFRYEVTANGGESMTQLSGLVLWDGDEMPK